MDRQDLNRLPLKNYNLTVTGTNWTTVKAIGTPYQTASGAWRILINVQGTFSSGTTSVNLTVAGLSFDLGNAGGAMGVGSSPYHATCQLANNTLICNMGSSTTQFYLSADALLSAKPTWME